MTTATQTVLVGGPFYEDLELGQVFDSSPGVTLTAGAAAVHQAVLGDRLRLALDADLCDAVAGPGGQLAHPGLVCDIAIGQSTLVTGRVIANLFYRGLALRRAPRLGDTLRTTTEVVALRDNSVKPGRAPTGLAALRIRTVDQHDRPVLDFHRCAMLPLRGDGQLPGHRDDLDLIAAELPGELLAEAAAGLDLARYRELVPGGHGSSFEPGTRFVVECGETVGCAPELVRLTLNLAAAHSDPTSSGRGQRLVYGGHTIGVAFSQLTRALPNLVTVAGWRSCDHLAPVFEGDVLYSEITVEALSPVAGTEGVLVELSVQTAAVREQDCDGDGERVPVLDWRLVGVMAA